MNLENIKINLLGFAEVTIIVSAGLFVLFDWGSTIYVIYYLVIR